MKYMLLIHVPQQFDGLSAWSQDDFKAMIEYMRELDRSLRASGELLDANGLGGPGAAKTIRAGADGSAGVSDGLRNGSSDALIGYWVVDVASHERAIEIATLVSATPGPGGAPVNQPVELHPIGEAPEV
jgi:hypothetical protein